MKEHFDRLLTAVLVIAAAAMAVTFVHRQATGDVDRGPAHSRTAVKDWSSLVRSGVLVGDSTAKVKVVEFGDFECPFCRRADSVFRVVKEKYGSDVALVYVHFPLTIHRFAIPAARASECAADQGKFAEMHDLLFRKQDSLGLKSWASYARESGVADSVTFDQCVSRSDIPLRVQIGLDLGRALGLHGTPVVIVNGWRLEPPPTIEEIEHEVDLTKPR